MSRFEKLAIGALLWGATCSACHYSHQVPYRLRPDTRMILGVVIDSTALQQTLQTFQIAIPNEGAVCYQGILRDTTFAEAKGWILHLTYAKPAITDSADQYHVWFPAKGMVLSCVHPVAIGHSHPYSVGYCDHSLPDARLLFNTPEALVSVVWCGDGTLEMLYQDGRRMLTRWR